MIIYVLDDGETYTLEEPTAIVVTQDQLDQIEGGTKVYQVIPTWDEQPPYLCNCIKCTQERWDNHQLITAQNNAKDQQ